MSDILFLVTTDGEAETAVTLPSQPCRIKVPAGAVVETLDETSGKWQPVTIIEKKAHHPVFDWSILDG